MNGWTVGLLLVILLWTLVLLAFARPLRARWREPVFRHPALVVESDDWGAGPFAQSEALTRIAAVLQSFRDSTGRSPVMTLGIVFEVPDAERLAREELTSYRGRGLDDACFEQLRRVIQSGVVAGVFAPQLHGQCHYWPQALMTAAQSDAGVRAWLTGAPLPETEDLPAHLQITLDRGIAAAFARPRRGADCGGGRGGGGELPKTVRRVAGGRCADDIYLERRCRARLEKRRSRSRHHAWPARDESRRCGRARRGRSADAHRRFFRRRTMLSGP